MARKVVEKCQTMNDANKKTGPRGHMVRSHPSVPLPVTPQTTPYKLPARELPQRASLDRFGHLFRGLSASRQR